MPAQYEPTICTSNSAEWCDRVCRAHGVPGTFTPEIWFQPRIGPPYYSNAIILTRSGLTEQYAAIAQLEEALPQGFSVKDAFASLDLTKSGFHVLFDAEWQPHYFARCASGESDRLLLVVILEGKLAGVATARVLPENDFDYYLPFEKKAVE
jgi:hypothetical protein